MIKLPYSIVIEATSDPKFFCFFSTELGGFTGTGRSVEHSIRRAQEGMKDHVAILRKEGLPIPRPNPGATIIIRNDTPRARRRVRHARRVRRHAA